MERLKGSFVLFAGLAFCSFVFAGDALALVEIEDSGPVEETRDLHGNRLTRINRTIGIQAGGDVSYNLLYRYFPGPEITGEEIERPLPSGLPSFPLLGDWTTRALGMGFRGAPWYQGGFLRVEIDGRALSGSIAEVRVSGGDERGTVEFLYDEKWGRMTLKIVQLAGDDKLYAEIDIDAEAGAPSVGLRFFSRPGHVGSTALPRNHWVATAERSLHGAVKETLVPENEYWMYSFDANANRPWGSGALLCLPEQAGGIEVDMTGGMTLLRLDLVEGATKARVILWHFPDDHKNREQAYAYLVEKAGGYAENLRGFEF